jgi:hypothetical protein
MLDIDLHERHVGHHVGREANGLQIEAWAPNRSRLVRTGSNHATHPEKGLQP